jgi:hypothetical protein
LMLHACLYTIFFVFCYTSWHFYAFSGTNLLMRCHSASSLFSAILCFRKATQVIFSELDETKAKVPIFPDARWSPKLRQRGTRGRPHHGVARASPWSRHQVVGLPGPAPDAALCLYIPLDGKTLRPDQFSMKHTVSHRRRRREIRRVQKLFPPPCQRGESPPEAFFITMPTSGVMGE